MLDYYYQILEVPKGATDEALRLGYLRVKQRANQSQATLDHLQLLDKAYEILSNVRVERQIVTRSDGRQDVVLKYHPNPNFYKQFYGRINDIKENKRKVWEKEYKGKLIWLYRFFTFFWLVIGIIMIWGPISIMNMYENWWYLPCFSPLFYGTYYMYFKAMNWNKFRFEKNGKWL